MTQGGAAKAVERPAFSNVVAELARIGLLSFRGPAAPIALMHRVLVEERRWMGERLYAV